MSNSTTYIDYSAATPIKAAWLNDVNQLTYVVCGDGSLNPPTTAAQLLTNLGISTTYAPIATTATLAGPQTLTNKTLLAATNTVEAASGPNTTPLFGRNVLINSNFGMNQRVVSGTVTLVAGIYGHDRWKAGAGGCTYTFSTTNNVTTITIIAGTLQQVVEGAQLYSGTYSLSWTGTATGRIDSGSYGGSGTTGTAVGGTNQTVEFSTGTVSKVQYEPGSKVTPWSSYFGIYGGEGQGCQRYYQLLYFSADFNAYTATQIARIGCGFPVTMRAAPTAGTIAMTNSSNNTGSSVYSVNANYVQLQFIGGVAGNVGATGSVPLYAEL